MTKVIVQHHVADYDRWYPIFTEHEKVRRTHGAQGHTITRSVADPNNLLVVTDFATADGARAFAEDPSLKSAMARAGIDGGPQVWIVDEAEARTY
jgi:heme-degrading monooxygenase HmoA